MSKISAIDIKKLWYADQIVLGLTPSFLYNLIKAGATTFYAVATSGTPGALKCVSTTPDAGEVAVSTVNAATLVGAESVSAGDYVILVSKANEIENVHQDTWQIDESEASQDSYRNQLTGHVYRLGKRQMGDLTVNFTVGQYDYATKAALMGGAMLDSTGATTTTPSEAVGWQRSNDVVEMYKTLIALTVDDVFVVVSRSSLGARESSTDGAIGMAMSGTMTDPIVSGVASEYWYDSATVYPPSA